MTMLIKILLIVLIGIYFSACAPKSSDASTVAAFIPDEVVIPIDEDNKDVPTVAPIAPVIVQPTTGNAFSVTYYKYTETYAPQASYPTKTITATGSCAMIQAKTYCWDDGLKILTIVVSGKSFVFGYNYWDIHKKNDSNGFSSCRGGCTSSYLETPKQIINSLKSTIEANSTNSVAAVFSDGVQVTENCLENAGVVTCSNFEIVLAQ